MIFFSRKPKLEFLCRAVGVLEVHPIRLAGEKKPKWFTEAAKKFKTEKHPIHNNNTIAKCQGIKDLFNKAWVVSAWQDIYINVNSDGSFTWRTKIPQAHIVDERVPLDDLSFHSFDTFRECPHLAKQIPILKVQTPWAVKIPSGYSMMQTNVPYQEHDLFTTATGLFSHKFGYMELNIQLFIHRQGEFVIQAGTPLAYLYLVKDVEPDAVVRYITDEERNTLDKCRLIRQLRFIPRYSEIKSLIAKLNKGK